MEPTAALDATIERARVGDPDAWEALYRHAYPKLFTYLSRRVGRAEVDDVIHEVFARAMNAIQRYAPGPSGIDGWFFGIARNVVLETYRRNGRELATDPDDSRPIESDEPAPGDQLLADEQRVELRAAFERLDPDERELLELRVIGGLSSAAVASIVDRTPGSVRTAQSRAMGRLRTFFQQARP